MLAKNKKLTAVPTKVEIKSNGVTIVTMEMCDDGDVIVSLEAAFTLEEWRFAYMAVADALIKMGAK